MIFCFIPSCFFNSDLITSKRWMEINLNHQDCPSLPLQKQQCKRTHRNSLQRYQTHKWKWETNRTKSNESFTETKQMRKKGCSKTQNELISFFSRISLFFVFVRLSTTSQPAQRATFWNVSDALFHNDVILFNLDLSKSKAKELYLNERISFCQLLYVKCSSIHRERNNRKYRK